MESHDHVVQYPNTNILVLWKISYGADEKPNGNMKKIVVTSDSAGATSLMFIYHARHQVCLKIVTDDLLDMGQSYRHQLTEAVFSSLSLLLSRIKRTLYLIHKMSTMIISLFLYIQSHHKGLFSTSGFSPDTSNQNIRHSYT